MISSEKWDSNAPHVGTLRGLINIVTCIFSLSQCSVIGSCPPTFSCGNHDGESTGSQKLLSGKGELSPALLLSMEKPWWLKHFFLHLFVFLDFSSNLGSIDSRQKQMPVTISLVCLFRRKKSIAVFNIIKSICSWESPCSDTRAVSYPQTCSRPFSCESPWHPGHTPF